MQVKVQQQQEDDEEEEEEKSRTVVGVNKKADTRRSSCE